MGDSAHFRSPFFGSKLESLVFSKEIGVNRWRSQLLSHILNKLLYFATGARQRPNLGHILHLLTQ